MSVPGRTRCCASSTASCACAIDGDEHLLSPGGEAIVPAGFHHTLGAVSGEARIVMGFRAEATRRW